MKKQSILSLKTAALIAALASATALRAATVQTTPLFNAPTASANPLQTVAFRDSAEANLLRDAYHILATGDHDYKGHRAKAMHSVEAAGKLLGVDLVGDLKDHSPQALSDARLREAQDLIGRVLNSAEVRGQKRVVKHLNAAVSQINSALRVR
jgi:ABC-type sugar transport system substrate-binding protein